MCASDAPVWVWVSGDASAVGPRRCALVEMQLGSSKRACVRLTHLPGSRPSSSRAMYCLRLATGARYLAHASFLWKSGARNLFLSGSLDLCPCRVLPLPLRRPLFLFPLHDTDAIAAVGLHPALILSLIVSLSHSPRILYAGRWRPLCLTADWGDCRDQGVQRMAGEAPARAQDCHCRQPRH